MYLDTLRCIRTLVTLVYVLIYCKYFEISTPPCFSSQFQENHRFSLECLEGGTCRQSSSQRRLGGCKKGSWVRCGLYQIHTRREWRCKCLTCLTKCCQKCNVATWSIGNCIFDVDVGVFGALTSTNADQLKGHSKRWKWYWKPVEIGPSRRWHPVFDAIPALSAFFSISCTPLNSKIELLVGPPVKKQPVPPKAAPVPGTWVALFCRVDVVTGKYAIQKIRVVNNFGWIMRVMMNDEGWRWDLLYKQFLIQTATKIDQSSFRVRFLSCTFPKLAVDRSCLRKVCRKLWSLEVLFCTYHYVTTSVMFFRFR